MDRNSKNPMIRIDEIPSLSARRAWIEINTRNQPSKPRRVALRKESVDRNGLLQVCWSILLWSLSARRAWIEIFEWIKHKYPGCVALRKESVDRNKYVVQCRKVLGVSLSARRAWIEIGSGDYVQYSYNGRSPQGERG